jgi:hypothetical protein
LGTNVCVFDVELFLVKGEKGKRERVEKCRSWSNEREMILMDMFFGNGQGYYCYLSMDNTRVMSLGSIIGKLFTF